MFFVKFHNKKADSLAEYALVLGIVSLAIIGMNTYIKRGFQGRMKEMSDKFISSQQVVEMDPTTVTDSFTRIPDSGSAVTRQLLSGGAIQTSVADRTRIEIERHSVTQADPFSAPQETSESDSGVRGPLAEGEGGEELGEYHPLPPDGPGLPRSYGYWN